MRIFRRGAQFLALALSLVVVHRGAAQAQAPAAKVLVNVDRHGVGLQGYDPVAFFTDSSAVRGDSTHAAQYGGATYWFASEAHRVQFLSRRDKPWLADGARAILET